MENVLNSAAKSETKGKRRKHVKTLRGNMDMTFLFIVLALLAVGLIMLFSASYASSYYENGGNSFHFISRQLMFAALGITAMLIIANIDYHILHRLAVPILLAAIGLLVLALVIPYRSDAKRWISLGPFGTFQPSELAKFAVVVMFAHLISMNHDKMKDARYGLRPFMGILGVIAFLMILEPHLSGTVLIFAIGIVMMFVGGTDLKWFLLGGIVLVGVVVAVIFTPGAVDYAFSRVQYWIDPWSDPKGLGYQTLQSLFAIGSGGLFGVGIGNSRQKHLYLPEPHNDFIFSVACEELGFVGATLIILLFVLFVWRAFVIAMRCRDRFGSMLAIGLGTQVGVQAILNIAVVTNTIPNTGISLPFFSYGGSALFMLLAQMGVILSVSRQSNIEKT